MDKCYQVDVFRFSERENGGMVYVHLRDYYIHTSVEEDKEHYDHCINTYKKQHDFYITPEGGAIRFKPYFRY